MITFWCCCEEIAWCPSLVGFKGLTHHLSCWTLIHRSKVRCKLGSVCQDNRLWCRLENRQYFWEGQEHQSSQDITEQCSKIPNTGQSTNTNAGESYCEDYCFLLLTLFIITVFKYFLQASRAKSSQLYAARGLRFLHSKWYENKSYRCEFPGLSGKGTKSRILFLFFFLRVDGPIDARAYNLLEFHIITLEISSF